MKINLLIQDDKELRDSIKDMIRGQVKSVLREEIKDIAMAEFIRLYADTSKEVIINMVKDMVEKIVKKDLVFQSTFSTGAESYIRYYAREKINELLSKIRV